MSDDKDPKDEKARDSESSRVTRDVALEPTKPNDEVVKAGKSEASKGRFANEKEAALEADKRQDGGVPAKGTPHGKEDIKRKTKPVPNADSDDEAPFKTFRKVSKHDIELGDHRGAARAEEAHGGPREKKTEVKPALFLAEYDTPGAVMHAAEKVRDAGYTHWDTHTPFPVHGMDRAMGLPDSRLGWIVFVGGLTGVVSAVAMIQWMNGFDYPIVVGGKPPDAYASMVPIMFELMVLFSSFAAVFGMFGLNKIPMHYHPIFGSDRFRKVTDDKFFLSIECGDPKFHLEKTKAILEKTHPSNIELVDEEVAV